ncbi:kelch domain-containing protein 4 [Patella vulgata]|uniref:kelch domain-containing protein 4 n=1 Tax=Patella vulgata TaxID=6465 RepID=UPI0021809438|nr:kelch domain-containing protein 4 [Patella vulgata]
MGKKNKKDKKGKGQEKTALKTEKKAEKRAKRELAEIGEDDIKKQIAEYQDKAKDRTEVLEEKCPPPSPRCSMSLTANPDKEELFMFGGEYYTGKNMTLYNDLFIYNIKKNEWTRITAPNAPPPRSSHQAVASSQGGGQLWIFGGEFSSSSQSQFYHYRDLWVYHIKDKQWQMISAPGGPSSRSGHRMVLWKKLLVVFGGFHDNLREYKYFNDLYTFDLETYSWSRITATGIPPAPRSGCVMAVNQDSGKIVIYGGFCKEKVKKDVDKPTTYTDLFSLTIEGKGDAMKWKWSQMKQSGSRPTSRSGISAAVAPGNRAILFGGVYDKGELDDDDEEGIFFNEILSLDTDKGKWNDVIIRSKKGTTEKKKRRRNKEESEMNEETVEEAEECLDELKLDKQREATNDVDMETESSSVFTVKIGPQSSRSGDNKGEDNDDIFRPSPRMNCALSVKGSVLYLYGGLVEDGDKQITLADLYSLDLHKLDEWNIIIPEDKKLQVWEESSDEEDDDDDDEMEGADGGDDSSSSDEDSDDEEITFEDAPKQKDDESVADYFQRSKDYWVDKAAEIFEEDKSKISAQKLEKLAHELCKKALSDMKK